MEPPLSKAPYSVHSSSEMHSTRVSAEQKSFFTANGYLHLDQCISNAS